MIKLHQKMTFRATFFSTSIVSLSYLFIIDTTIFKGDRIMRTSGCTSEQLHKYKDVDKS